MNVFIILPAYDPEGYGEPLAVFASLDEAEARAAVLEAERSRKRYGWNWLDVFEIAVGDPDAKPVEVATTYRF